MEAHGTFYTSHCLQCKKEYNLEWMKGEFFICYLANVISPTYTVCDELRNQSEKNSRIGKLVTELTETADCSLHS